MDPSLPAPAVLRQAALELATASAPQARALLSGRLDAITVRAEQSLAKQPENAVDDLLAVDALMLQSPHGDAHETLLAAGARRVRDCLPLSAALLDLRRARSSLFRGGYEYALSVVVPLVQRLEAAGAASAPADEHRITGWPPHPAYLWSCAVSLQSAAERLMGADMHAARRCRTLRQQMSKAGLRAGELNATFHLGIALCNLDQLAEAESCMRRALRLSLVVGASRTRALAYGVLGEIALRQGDTALALGWTIEARHRLAQLGEQLWVGKLLAQEYRLLTELGDHTRARVRGEQAYAVGVLCDDFETQANIVLARPDNGGVTDDLHLASRTEARERALLWDLEMLGYERLRRRVLERSAVASGPRISVRGTTIALRGTRHDVVIDLGNRPVLMRVMNRLIDAQERGAPGVTAAQLVSAGWPGERPTGESGLNRVYATIHMLRKMGLDGVLERQEQGYCLALPIDRG